MSSLQDYKELQRKIYGQSRMLTAYTFLSPTYDKEVSRRFNVIALIRLLVTNGMSSLCIQNNKSPIHPKSYTVASSQPCKCLIVDRGRCEHCRSFKVHWSSAQNIYWNTWKNRRTAAKCSQNITLPSKQGNTLASLMTITYDLYLQR